MIRAMAVLIFLADGVEWPLSVTLSASHPPIRPIELQLGGALAF
jgi:hypothetical protein